MLDPTAAYRTAQVVGASRAGQIVLLYQGAIRFGAQHLAYLERRDLEQVLRNPLGVATGSNVTMPSQMSTDADISVMQTLHRMMFFKATADASDRMTNGIEKFVDLTDLLSLERAILVGD